MAFQLTHPCGCDGKNREIFLILSVLIGYIIQHNPLFFKYFFLFISNFMFLIQISGANLPRISCSLGVRTYLTILSLCLSPHRKTSIYLLYTVLQLNNFITVYHGIINYTIMQLMLCIITCNLGQSIVSQLIKFSLKPHKKTAQPSRVSGFSW